MRKKITRQELHQLVNDELDKIDELYNEVPATPIASEVYVDSSSFTGNLSGTDDTLQKSLEIIDAFVFISATPNDYYTESEIDIMLNNKQDSLPEISNGDAGKFLAVNDEEDGFEYVMPATPTNVYTIEEVNNLFVENQTYVPIGETTLTSTATQIDFTIPSEYTRIKVTMYIVGNAESVDNQPTFVLRCNDDDSGTYGYFVHAYNLAEASNTAGDATSIYLGRLVRASASSLPAMLEVEFDNVNTTHFTAMQGFSCGAYQFNTSATYANVQRHFSAEWRVTDKITKLSFISSEADSIGVGTRIALWGGG